MKELGPDARSLIDLAADGDGPTRRDRDRVRHAVMAAVGSGAALGSLTAAGGASAASAGGAAAAAGKGAGVAAASAGAATVGVKASAGALLGSGAVKISGWLILGGALGLGVAVPAMQANDSSAGARTPPARAATQAAKPLSQAKLATRAVAGNSPPSVEAPRLAKTPSDNTAELAPAPKTAARAAAKPTAGTAPQQVALASESFLLSQAQRELSAGNSQGALQALDQHAKRYPKGALSPERDAARVLALCAAGKRAEAEPLAAKFLAAHPSSPLAPRVRAACTK